MMRLSSRIRVALPTAVAALAVGALPVAAHPDAQGASGFARAVLMNAAGDEVGRVTFSDREGRVLISALASGLPPDFHGFHVHGTGLCEGPDFTSAGGHFNPSGQSHPSHGGDMPSLYVTGDGTAELHTVTDRYAVADLLGGTGTAVIVHANRDNYANIPARYAPAPDAMTLATGDAGARLACGLVQAADGPQDGDPIS